MSEREVLLVTGTLHLTRIRAPAVLRMNNSEPLSTARVSPCGDNASSVLPSTAIGTSIARSSPPLSAKKKMAQRSDRNMDWRDAIHAARRPSAENTGG